MSDDHEVVPLANPSVAAAGRAEGSDFHPVGFLTLLGTPTHLSPLKPHEATFFTEVVEVTHAAELAGGADHSGVTATGRDHGHWYPLTMYRRSTDSSAVNNSTTLVDDTVIAARVGKNRSYWFIGFIAFDSDASADIKFAFKDPSSSGASIRWGIQNASPGGWANAFGNTLVVASSGNDESVLIYGTGTMGATDGFITLQFAQNAANMSDTKLLIGTSLMFFFL